jgi:hypothetical protein
MLDGETLMERLLPDLEETLERERAMSSRIEELSDAELRRLLGALARHNDINGAAGELLGLCLVEASARFLKAKRTTEDTEDTEA